MYSVHFFSGWLTTSNISEETLRGSQYLENLQASYNDDNDGGDDHGKSDKGPDTENVTDMANKIFETQLADSGKKIYANAVYALFRAYGNIFFLYGLQCILHTGWFFNWASPEFAKCWPVSN